MLPKYHPVSGAAGGTRTHNLRFTIPLLYQLSYSGASMLSAFALGIVMTFGVPMQIDARTILTDDKPIIGLRQPYSADLAFPISSKIQYTSTEGDAKEIVTPGSNPSKKTASMRGRVGIASWYRYKHCLCAASTEFKKGSRLMVTRLSNGKSITVIVNDYGPEEAMNRIIDLDSVAYKQLGPLGSGIMRVRIEQL